MEKVDLEALDAMHAAATPGEWRGELHALHTREDIDEYGATYAQLTNGEHQIVGFFPVYDLEQCAALHNAYPALAAELWALRDRVASLYTGMRRVIVAAGGVAEDGVSDEFLLGAADEVSALREERDRLRAEVESLKAKWKREECAHCDERPGGHEGTIWCAECFNWHCSEAAKERMQSELDAAMAEAARLREALEDSDKRLCNHHNFEHIQKAHNTGLGGVCEICHEEPQVFQRNADVLNSTPTTAEWLAARDAEMKRLGAAEWLEKEAAENLERFGTHFYESTTDSMLAEAALLRAWEGK